MATYKIFSEIQTGKKFKTPSKITYQKMSSIEAKPVLKADGVTVIANGEVTSAFNKSKIQLEVI